MFELRGKYNSAKVFTDNVDNETISQVMALLNTTAAAGSQIRIMPDTHAGAGCVIGTTMTLQNHIVPNLVGYDIGCGMRAARLSETEIDFATLDRVIAERVPSGFDIHDTAIARADIDELLISVNTDRAQHSLGTLGGGNHFIEVDRDAAGRLWLVIHTGSRHLGVEVCKEYQQMAVRSCEPKRLFFDDIRNLIMTYKEQGREKEIQSALRELQESRGNIPADLCYLEGEQFRSYIHDMKIVQRYAYVNRTTILEQIVDGMGLHVDDSFDTVHNYIDCDHMVLRKGAISAQLGERVIIPMNMRDGSLICIGKGNPDWNCSAPHGAGRVLSRSQAKDAVSMDEFTESMKGIYTTSVCESTVDESPMVYKPAEEIIANISDTVTVEDVIKPIYNYKAH